MTAIGHRPSAADSIRSLHLTSRTPRIALVVASTRTHRFADLVAPWVVAELDMVSVRESVRIVGSQFPPSARAETPRAVHAQLEPELTVMVANLLRWARALSTARDV